MADQVASDVPVRPAATVVLLRDSEQGLLVWLQQRSPTLVFAGGMFAFPGGAVDDEDAVLAQHLEAVVDSASHGKIWGHSTRWASTLLVAACRETREEAGLDLAPASLTPWSRWITPVGSPRRFDAHFFVAPVPDGDEPRPLTGEVAGGLWLAVPAAVQRYQAGDLPMWPPTISTLRQLRSCSDVEAALAAAPATVEAITL
jgi:8-oxo-dGTP pyrophosphatase MutT (NUDIX family)